MTEKAPKHRADCTGEVWAIVREAMAGWWLMQCSGCGSSRLVRSGEERGGVTEESA